MIYQQFSSFPGSPVIIFFKTVHNFQIVSSKAENPEFEKSIYNPSGMYGMKVGWETFTFWSFYFYTSYSWNENIKSFTLSFSQTL